jgi:hypothetical protein
MACWLDALWMFNALEESSRRVHLIASRQTSQRPSPEHNLTLRFLDAYIWSFPKSLAV